MVERLVTISGLLFLVSDDPESEIVEAEIRKATHDMDSIVSVRELPRTGDGRKFMVIGTPR